MTPVRHRVIAVATATVLLVLPASGAWAAPANHQPATPSSLTVGGIACDAGGILVGTTAPRITAVFADPDLGTVQGETLTPTFAWWPVGKPAQRTEWTLPTISSPGTAFTALPATLVDAGRYRLAARATDAGGARSAWSPVCTFTVDTTRPHPPAVESADYPANGSAGGVGIAGTFTFAAAGGDRDVVKFRYSSSNGPLLDVPAGRDGRATVEITPAGVGTNTLTVQAIDRTGNRSAETAYSFSVLDREPKVMQENPDAGLGEPRTVQFWSAVPGTASFTYQLNDGPAATVAADANGRATATVTPDRRGDNALAVSSRTADGVVSPRITVNLYVPVQVPQPVISSPDFPDGAPPPTAGQEVTIVLRTDSPEVTEFVWSADLGETFQVVAADPDGNATIRYRTPDWSLYLEIQARARTADGFTSSTAYTGWELTPAETPAQ
ncbi:hypothetical protein [Actinoplanes sp. NPDC049599]|uniref:hypothetical protein n=1 Tax=Actinoplanes sp. NPDC049599 TaxID=3363903 RepID=UPI0037A0482C